MRARNLSPRWRWLVTGIAATGVALGFFVGLFLLVRMSKTPVASPMPRTVTLLEQGPPQNQAKLSGGKSAAAGLEHSATGEITKNFRMTLPALVQSFSIPEIGTPVVEVHALSFSATEMELGKVVDASVRRFLGLNGRGHGRHNWVSGGGGLFYLPDSGLRARQLAYTCPRIPPEHRETDGTVATLVTARVNREGRVTQVDFLDSRAAYRESLRDAMVSGWRFQPLVVHGHAMPFRLHFIIAVENGMRGIIGSHCTWDHFNRAHRGSLVPTWIVYVPKHGLPIAYAYIAPQHLGEAPGGLVSVSNEEGGKP